jgi:TolB-like protein/Flp pilus assembly protein TadD
MWDRLPTIAVLPFDGGAEADTYFGDGITEEIITGLSLNRSLFVIARDSALRFRGAGASTTAAAELGVRYILVGSVRRLPPRLKINVELIDTTVNRVIWADGFEGADDDLFKFQSEIAARITAAIDPSIREAEIQRIQGGPTNAFGAYECVLRGISQQFGEEEEFEQAGQCFRRAIEIDPRYAQAHAHLARWHSLRVGEGRSSSPGEDRTMADRFARRAIELDPRDAWVLATGGHIQSFLHKRFAAALDMFDQALRLNPNSVTAWSRSGTTLAYVGRGEEALERVRNAMRLSPFDHQTFSFCTTNGLASIVNGRYDEAVSWLSRGLRLSPRYRAATRLLIAALALAGEVPEARERAKEFLAAEPTFTVSGFGAWYPLQSPHLERVLYGLRTAGLPG